MAWEAPRRADRRSAPPDVATYVIARWTNGDVRVAIDASGCIVLRFPRPVEAVTVTNVDHLVDRLLQARLDRDIQLPTRPT